MKTYRTTLRPVSSFTIPSGVRWSFVAVPRDATFRPDLPRSEYRYGTFTTDRELTADEMRHFDIVEI